MIPDYHFKIAYKYRTSSDEQPSPPSSPLRRLFNLQALRGGGD